jgi:hypothetical protein
MTEIEWINHAGFVIKHGDIALACDPWLDGAAFNEGWSLISPTLFKPEDFARVTHIWFSHEHPDHFSPKNIREVPPQVRQGITVLFQKTRDGKLIKFCRDLGFRVVELESGASCKLAADFTITCCTHRGAHRTAAVDSILFVQAGKIRLLNLNDYIPDGIAELRAIRERSNDLTVLFTQFSYANWVGNPGDNESKQRAAETKISSLRQQIAVLRPAFVVPFASYILFSNVENFHMNSHMNKIGDVHDIISHAGAIPIVLYPGERWPIGEKRHCQPALSRYAEDVERALAAPPRYSGHTVPLAQLMEEAESFRQKMLTVHAAVILRIVPSTIFWIKDYGRACSFSYRHGLRECPDISQESCDISALSGAISHCFRTAWGADTLHVNGCFLSPSNKHSRFFSSLAPSRYSNAGIKLDLKITAGSLARKLHGMVARPTLFSQHTMRSG